VKDNKNTMISRGLVMKCTTRANNSHDENVMESIKSRDELFIKMRNLLSSVPSVLSGEYWIVNSRGLPMMVNYLLRSIIVVGSLL
jgi:hypothetical protein